MDDWFSKWLIKKFLWMWSVTLESFATTCVRCFPFNWSTTQKSAFCSHTLKQTEMKSPPLYDPQFLSLVRTWCYGFCPPPCGCRPRLSKLLLNDTQDTGMQLKRLQADSMGTLMMVSHTDRDVMLQCSRGNTHMPMRCLHFYLQLLWYCMCVYRLLIPKFTGCAHIVGHGVK